MKDYQHRFVKIVTEAREYYKMIRNLEDAVGGIIIEAFHDFPNAILLLLEEESRREWTDAIWERVFNYELKDDLPSLLEDIMNLPCEEIDE